MTDNDYDEDIYEETTSKVVYKRRSAVSHAKLKERDYESEKKKRYQSNSDTERMDDEEDWTTTATINLTKRRNADDDSASRRRSSTSIFDRDSEHVDHKRTHQSAHKSRSFNEFPLTKDLFTKKAHLHKSGSVSSNVEKGMRDWSERAKRTPTDKDKARKYYKDFVSKDAQPYYPVSKWEVDYTNQNYVRSKCIKPQGLHRYVHGRPFDWDVDYDNNYYVRSKVNAPKGLHRHTYEFKRKRVPDDDDLGDATGWMFEYGPEYDQVEGDVPFHRRERIVGKGGYRFYGVRRNNSDSDIKAEEKREEIKDIFEEELQYGHEFLQDDVPHIVEFKDMRIGRGGYRHHDVARNKCDMKPKDVLGVDYRASRARMDSDVEEEIEVPRKGKPFQQTIFKKTFRLIKPPSVENFNHGTVLSFVPGVGSRSFYEGKSTRPSSSRVSGRSFYEGKSTNKSSAGEKRTKSPTDKTKTHSWKRNASQSDTTERHSFPPEVQNRINEIRGATRNISSRKITEDWKEHEHHPYDSGKFVTEGYDKFVNENGDEIWIKTEEKYSEFHHKKKK